MATAARLFTDDDQLAKVMREIRVHGQDRRYHHPRLGVNGRLDTLQAAVLLAKMEIFEDEVAARAQIGARYSSMIDEAFGKESDPGRRVSTPLPCAGLYERLCAIHGRSRLTARRSKKNQSARRSNGGALSRPAASATGVRLPGSGSGKFSGIRSCGSARVEPADASVPDS